MTKRIKPTGFGTRLRSLREAKQLTQKDLSEKAGVHPLTIAAFEQGRQEPMWSTVLDFADALGVRVEAFVVPEAERASAEPVRLGRPPKKPEEAQAEAPKRPRGRPRKSG